MNEKNKYKIQFFIKHLISEKIQFKNLLSTRIPKQFIQSIFLTMFQMKKNLFYILYLFLHSAYHSVNYLFIFKIELVKFKYT